MEPSTFFRKLLSRYLWLNLLAMAAVVVVFSMAVKVLIDVYTHHGEVIVLPDVRNVPSNRATDVLEELGMEVQISDTGYNKKLPIGTILAMTPEPGVRIKSGRIIHLTVNGGVKMVAIPDIIENSSYRTARIRLTACGFKVGEPQYVPGEPDWVYGILVNGHNVAAGQKVSVESILILQVGNGNRLGNDSTYYQTGEGEYYEETEEVEEEAPEVDTGEPKEQVDDTDGFEIVE